MNTTEYFIVYDEDGRPVRLPRTPLVRCTDCGVSHTPYYTSRSGALPPVRRS
jgi:hypothetical protein